MKKPMVKLNPQESDGVTRRGRGRRDTESKFLVGQVVAIKEYDSFGKLLDGGNRIRGEKAWTFKGINGVYPESALRPLTKRERGHLTDNSARTIAAALRRTDAAAYRRGVCKGHDDLCREPERIRRIVSHDRT